MIYIGCTKLATGTDLKYFYRFPRPNHSIGYSEDNLKSLFMFLSIQNCLMFSPLHREETAGKEERKKKEMCDSFLTSSQDSTCYGREEKCMCVCICIHILHVQMCVRAFETGFI